MEEMFFSFIMLVMMVFLFCLRYIVPIFISIIGALLIKKKNKKIYGSILIILGLAIEVVSIEPYEIKMYNAYSNCNNFRHVESFRVNKAEGERFI